MDTQKNNILYKKYLFFFIIYSCSYWLLIINPYNYWDGLLIANLPYTEIKEMFWEAGAPWTGYIHIMVQKYLGGTATYRLFSFFLYFFSGILLYQILQKLRITNESQNTWIISLFLTLPINFARISIISFPGSLYYFIFWLAIYCLVKSDLKNLNYLITSIILFLISFNLNSLLPFYYNIILFYLILSKRKALHQNKIILVLLFIIPLVYWFFKNSLFIKYGAYSTYNKFNLHQLLCSFYKNAIVIKNFIYNTFLFYFNNLSVNCILFITILFIILSLGYYFLIKSNQNEKLSINKKRILKYSLLFCCSLALIYSAAFAYTVASKFISIYYYWGTRFQIILSLGVAFLIVSVVYLLLKNELAIKILLIFIICFFITINNKIYYNFLIDGLKQEVFVNQIKGNQNFIKNTTFHMNDKNMDFALNRFLNYYEYSTLFKKAFKTETKLGYTYLRNYLPPKTEFTSRYNLKNYTFDPEKSCYVYLDYVNPPDKIEIIKYFIIRPLKKTNSIEKFSNIISIHCDNNKRSLQL